MTIFHFLLKTNLRITRKRHRFRYMFVMMRHWKKGLIFILVLLFAGVTEIYAQDGGNAEGGATTGQEPTGKAARRKAKKEWKKQRKTDMQDAKAKKEYNEKYNTKKTRKRMKKAEKQAKRNNEHKREFFLKRWFKKRK
jgi:hypothetical protein